MDDVGKLILFRDVVDLGGFSRAARKWNLSHSTVSKHIKTLEEKLRSQLLRRTSRTMSLTPHGRIVYEHSRRIGGSFDEMMQRLDELRGRISGELRVSCLVHVGKHVVQPAMASFLAEYPEVRVTLLLDDGPLAFHRQELDLAVRVGLPTEESLIATKLIDNHVCIVAAPELLERCGAVEHPSQLAELPTVAYASEAVAITTWAYRDGGENKTVATNPVCRINDGNLLLDAVRSGVGFGYLSAFAARADIERGTLVKVFSEDVIPAYDPVTMLYAPSDYASPKLEAFKKQLVETARALR